MSGFLTNLASRARGTVARLEPRKPAPYEARVGRAVRPEGDIEQSLDMAVPPMPFVSPSKLSLESSSAPVFASAPSPNTSIGMTAATPTALASPVMPTMSAPAQPARRMSMAPQVNAAAPLVPAATSALPASTLSALFSTASVPSVVTEPTVNPIAERKNILSDVPPSPQLMPPAPEAPAVAPTLQTYEHPPKTTHAMASVEAVLPTNPEDPKRPAPSLLEPQVDLAMVRHDGPKPLLEREVLAPHPASAPAMQPSNVLDVSTPEAPQVEIHIGTIEVVAEAPSASEPYSAAAPTRGMSLDDFLDGTGAL